MPIEARIRTPFSDRLDLPPGYRLTALREVGDAFSHAMSIAAEEGAGTLIYVGRFDLAEFALVLEPDEPLRSARRVFYAGLAALADALATHAPPEKPILFEWPDAIRIDGGLVGGGRLGWPKDAPEDEPSWLVFSGMIRTVSMGADEPGVQPLATALEDEGFGDSGSAQIVESFARHFLSLVDSWRELGFKPVAESYLSRLPSEERVERSIDGVGDLLIRRTGKIDVEKRKLLPALARPTWLDPISGGPRR